MMRINLFLVPILAVSGFVFPATPAQAELPLCAPYVPMPVRDGRFVRGRHKIVCNKEMVSITVVGILTRTHDLKTYFELKRKVKSCALASDCGVRTRGTLVARRRQWIHAWARGLAIYECKPGEDDYCTPRERRERKRKKIRIAWRRSECLLVGGSATATQRASREAAPAGRSCG